MQKQAEEEYFLTNNYSYKSLLILQAYSTISNLNGEIETKSIDILIHSLCKLAISSAEFVYNTLQLSSSVHFLFHPLPPVVLSRHLFPLFFGSDRQTPTCMPDTKRFFRLHAP